MMLFGANIIFKNPTIFWLVVPLVLIIFFLRRKKLGALWVPSATNYDHFTSWRTRFLKYLPILLYTSLLLLFVAMADPIERRIEENESAEGIDIVMVMDASYSMLAKDFTPNRMGKSKELAIEFVDRRKFDRLGLVIFAGESKTICPLTTDRAVLKKKIKTFTSDLHMGTGIGLGLAMAVNRLSNDTPNDKVVILMTDGINNAGFISPTVAVQMAQSKNIKVYAIGIGSRGLALSFMGRNADGTINYDYAKVSIDEEILQEIADKTGGKYYRADNDLSFEKIYDEINQLEKVEVEKSQVIREIPRYRPFAGLALLFLLLYYVLRQTIFKSTPELL